MQFEGPEMVLQEGVDYGAVIHTSCGDISLDLLEEEAPVTVNNFVFLAREGYYDGLEWFRVESNSVIETGDPNNQLFEPPDDPGYTIEEELPDEPRDYIFGAVAMANEGRPDTTGSNFFIVIHENRPAGYQAAYSIFGRVAKSSAEVLLEIGKQPVKGGNVPLEAVRPSVPIYVESIEITEN
jgi:peptidylprolyl isomerase